MHMNRPKSEFLCMVFCSPSLFFKWLILTVVYDWVSDKAMSLVSVLIFPMLQPAKRHSYAQSGCFPEERELIFDIVRNRPFEL